MNPIKHIIITTMISTLYFQFTSFNYYVLYSALLSTILIDVIDHSATILFQNNDLSLKTRMLLKKGSFLEAYMNYYRARKKYIKHMYFHNIFFLILIFVVSFILYFVDMTLLLILLFGPILHLLCDILENFTCDENLEFWTLKVM